jgi:hypothetical protein
LRRLREATAVIELLISDLRPEAGADEDRSRMLRPRPCLYAAGTAGDMTCGICGPLRFGLTGDARGGGWFLALVVPEIPA